MEKANEKKPAANRKRNRPKWNRNDDNAHEEGAAEQVLCCLQTPHTLRLLKLIQEGTLEHARIAACHLSCLDASPIVLWDLLGRLQAFLGSSQWSTRLHASLAMQGVAQHIPPCDQKDFIEATYSGPLWLTVEQVSQELEAILSQGRILLAESSCDDTNHQDSQKQDLLQRLDESQEELQQDFVDKRVRLQREILAQRLGLRGVVQAVGGTVLSEAITEQDLLMMDDDTKKHETNRIHHSKRQRMKQKEEEEEDSGSIRALLVMEMQQQQQEHDGSGAAASHRNPQTLLATELIFRMFDPSWHVRHGACLGILSLLRAWKGVVGHGAFGMWPLDIMARCLCLLSLDRFGDYSGASLGDENGGGESVVAPVREVAGQVLSILWSMAPAPIQKSCLRVLVCFSTRVEWEVRHSALLAFKYIIVLLSSSILKTMPEESSIAPMNEISQVAQTCLADKMEDVQSVAAQVLLRILEAFQGDLSKQKQLIRSSSLQLWDSLDQLRDVSSCAVDFVRLFSVMICQDSSLVCSVLASNRGEVPVVMSNVVDKLLRFLDFDSTAVNISALKAIGRLPVAFLSRLKDFKEQKEISESLMRSYCSLLERVFLSYTVGRYALPPHENDTESRTRYDNLCAARDASWERLVNSAGPVLAQSPAVLNNLLLRLMMAYVKIEHDSGGRDAAVLSPISAGALSRLVVKVKDSVDNAGTRLDDFLELVCSLLLKSPWKEHCEMACILVHSLMSNGYHLLPQSHELLQRLQQSTPPCLSPNLESHSRNILSKPMTIEAANLALSSVLATVLVDRGATRDVSHEIFWHASLESTGFIYPTLENDGGLAPVSTSSMQVYSMIAGAIVSGGYEHLPLRLTPLVRALMTSIKSERKYERLLLTCQSVAVLLGGLSSSENEVRLRVRNKVVENLCAMLSRNDASESSRESSDMACQPASHILALLVSRLPDDKTLAYIPPIWDRLRLVAEASQGGSLDENLRLLLIVANALKPETDATHHVIGTLVVPLIPIASSHRSSTTRIVATSIIVTLCHTSSELAMDTSLPVILSCLQDMGNDSKRLGSLRLLQSIIEAVNIDVCPFVRCLLPVTMAMMTDPLDECAKQAAQSFATLVRISPLVKGTERRQWEQQSNESQTENVIDHLIHGKPLPPCILPESVTNELNKADVSLRDYQMEGITWLRFLHKVRLNGILADDMGLGKTLQALSAVALSHEEAARADASSKPVSLVVCPSTLLGHWLAEIQKFFPRQTVLKGASKDGICERKNGPVVDVDCNIVVISYSSLRREASVLSNIKWHYCILDEGHLLKNPKTATAISARRLQAEHKLILTGTPVQNRVHELWAAFDFLMPNFLGSQSWFSKNFARPISNGQLQASSAESISEGMEKLKLLHQQVLPFILRREKEQVMKELPPKCITDIPCSMTSEQQDLYESFCDGADARKAVAVIQESINDASGNGNKESKLLGGDALKSLLYLRLLCTHPSLVESRTLNAHVSRSDAGYTRFDSSGKLKVLNDLLRSARICGEELTAADNDSSALYTDFDENDTSVDDASALFSSDGDVGDMMTSSARPENMKGSKCLIFAQFTQSLDVVERLLFQTQMPSLRYLRLDGSVPPDKRAGIVDTFNRDESIKVLLLTSRVGSLGLNLTGASTVIFLEHDYNPHADLQAMDRAHRIGQSKTVNVYRLITQNTIEEKIMKLQKTKMAMSKAIVNSENSTMYSMGTDRLLDIFTFRSDSENKSKASSKASAVSLDAIEDEYNGEDYASLSLKSFINGFRDVTPQDEAPNSDAY